MPPGDLGAVHRIGGGGLELDQGAVFAGEGFHFGIGDVVQPAFGFDGTITQGEVDASAGIQKKREFAEGAVAGWLRQVHEDRAEVDEVELESGVDHLGERGERIGDPADVRMRMGGLRMVAHFLDGFHGHHLIALGGEPGGIAARTGAHIQHLRRAWMRSNGIAS